MGMTTDRSRVEKGVPSGGQFATESKASDDLQALTMYGDPVMKIETPFSGILTLDDKYEEPLPEWPLDDEPVIDFEEGDDGVEVRIWLGDRSALFYRGYGGDQYDDMTYVDRADGFGEAELGTADRDEQDDRIDALREYGHAVRDRLQNYKYGLMAQAMSNDIRTSMLHLATGGRSPMSTGNDLRKTTLDVRNPEVFAGELAQLDQIENELNNKRRNATELMLAATARQGAGGQNVASLRACVDWSYVDNDEAVPLILTVVEQYDDSGSKIGETEEWVDQRVANQWGDIHIIAVKEERR